MVTEHDSNYFYVQGMDTNIY